MKVYQDELATYLDVKLAKCGLKIIDKINDDYGAINRGAGIKDYLQKLKYYGIEVNNYVILDDLPFDYLKAKLTKNLIKTNYENGGLKLKHVMKAIDLLNSKRKD